jgi:hypothetical protein
MSAMRATLSANRRQVTVVLQLTPTVLSREDLVSTMSRLKRHNQEQNIPLNALRGVKLLILGAAVAVSGLAALLTMAGPAYAGPTPSISASGGAGWLSVTGGPFAPNATVGISVLSNPGGKWVGGTSFPSEDIHADASGYIAAAFNVTSGTLSRTYSGPVYVLADQISPTPSFGTVGASGDPVVDPPPQFLINNTGQPSCGSPVNVEIAGFDHFDAVRVELLSQDLSKLLDKRNVTSDFVGDVALSPSSAAQGLPLSTGGYTGGAWIIADEYGGYPVNGVTVGYHLNLC